MCLLNLVTPIPHLWVKGFCWPYQQMNTSLWLYEMVIAMICCVTERVILQFQVVIINDAHCFLSFSLWDA